MRLWDYKLLKFLPKQMLVSQWRECIAIKRQWKKETLKHKLVSYVMDYDKEMFLLYVSLVIDELSNRNIHYNSKYYSEIFDFCYQGINTTIFIPYTEHNDIYLRECLYNLEEKAMRGIISKEEWQVIYDKFKDFTELWKGE